MPLDTIIAGQYTGTYNSVDVGITRDGFELSQGSKAEVFDESDAYGGSVVDWVYRGGDAFLQFTSKTYKAGAITPFWPWGGLGVMKTTAAPIGRWASNVAAATVLTAVANTPAAAAPATVTASKSILAPNFDGKLLFNSKLREVPVRLQLLPYAGVGSGDLIWFSLT